MLVHQSQAGCIIGKGGLKVKELREVSLHTSNCPIKWISRFQKLDWNFEYYKYFLKISSSFLIYLFFLNITVNQFFFQILFAYSLEKKTKDLVLKLLK